MVHDQVSRFFNGFRRDAHPMAIMVGVVGALSAFYHHNNLDIENVDHREITAIRLIAKVPTLAAWSYKYTVGQPLFTHVTTCYAENFLYMMFAMRRDRDYKVIRSFMKAMDRIFRFR